MAQLSIVGPADGEVAHLGPVALRVLEDGSTTDHRLGVVEITVAPHSDGPPQHRHSQHDEGFYVVSGTIRFTIGDTVYDARAGAMATVPPGVPHTFGNPDGEPAVMLATMTPDLYMRYFEDLRDWIRAGRPMTPEDNAEIMSRYATVVSTEHGPEAG